MSKKTPIRIHIVGCAPRSGTTLLFELINSCFDVVAFGDHEISLFKTPKSPPLVYCSKNPGEMQIVSHMIHFDTGLWCLYVVRDPRDVIVSTHLSSPGRYWVDLDVWQKNDRFANRLRGHPRFVVVRYEDLVNSPDTVQETLLMKMAFLSKKNNFGDYAVVAKPSEGALVALGGVRKIDNSSVGNWRNHLPRVAGQIALHGDICLCLRDLSYEREDEWMKEIHGVLPNIEGGADDWTSSRKIGLLARAARRLKLLYLEIRYILGMSEKV